MVKKMMAFRNHRKNLRAAALLSVSLTAGTAPALAATPAPESPNPYTVFAQQLADARNAKPVSAEEMYRQRAEAYRNYETQKPISYSEAFKRYAESYMKTRPSLKIQPK